MKKTLMVITMVLAILVVVTIGIKYRSRDDSFDKDFLRYFEKIVGDKEFATTAKIKTASLAESVEAPILVYHSVIDYPPFLFKKFTKITVSPEMFEKQMRYLADNHYNVVSLQALLNYFTDHASLPPKPIVITFDDGWESQYRYALPILQRHNYTATFFVFTNAIGHRHFMTWEQLRKLDEEHMTIGGHTKSHPYLMKISDDSKLRDEILGGKKIIEEHIGKSIVVFAYPFGHYNDHIIDIVKEAGYQAARSTYKGLQQTSNNLFTLKGIQVTNSFEDFIANLKNH